MRKILWGLAITLLVVSAAILSLQAPTQWQPGEVVRTPQDRFNNLPDYPFAANYKEISGYRVHYLDEGPRDGSPILLLHGQPSWSYLYRHMIPPLAAAGFRVVVPDLVGFGKSDKPIAQSDYSYQMHVDVITTLVRELDLRDATFFGQDWGGLIGLRVVADEPDRFARIMISNTGLPAAGGIGGWVGYPLFRMAVWAKGDVNELAPEGTDFSFASWVAYALTTDNFDMENLFQTATSRELSKAELAGYAAPFPDEAHLAGARIFPYLVPSQLRQNDRAMREVYDQWSKPFLTAFGDSDPVTAGMDSLWQERVPGAAGQPHVTVQNANHFIQEDQPERLVELLSDFIEGS
ncbi:alpha/beta fold hydrolase [Halieaceae bacterium IMCC14734]|uniref:Alpha/beta fold hydrolase n=1 Tax=Candidatus Litorirhabdus singularis TaxID=2518993 RepID=A0ABT3TF19_9GAMM|nr:haloalkane dehalogenase [Candidatus Litorirhabdus singularis]MCX2980908.1 alpha/beta fold hydrolase [Candidatus Litorirhabdus singularis]